MGASLNYCVIFKGPEVWYGVCLCDKMSIFSASEASTVIRGERSEPFVFLWSYCSKNVWIVKNDAKMIENDAEMRKIVIKSNK